MCNLVFTLSEMGSHWRGIRGTGLTKFYKEQWGCHGGNGLWGAQGILGNLFRDHCHNSDDI